MQNLYQDLEGLLQTDQTYISDGKILKNIVIEHAEKMESELLQLLMQSEPIRKHFFTEKFDNVLIFDKKKIPRICIQQSVLTRQLYVFQESYRIDRWKIVS